MNRSPHPVRTSTPPPDERGGAAAAIFVGEGAMAARCRALDWAATPLGPVAHWPSALRTTAALVLASPLPTFLYWGAEHVQLYNDAAIPVLGAKHPTALGAPARDAWAETWELFGAPLFARVLAGETVTLDAQRYELRLRGPDAPTDERFVTSGFVPVRDEQGVVRGVLVTSTDVTEQRRAPALDVERVRLAQALEVERARLAEVFRRAPSFVVAYRGPEQVYEFVNEAYYQLVGHREVVGKPLLEAIPEVRGQGFKELLDRVRETGEPWVGRESPVQLQRTPGAELETRYLDMVFQPLAEADGTRSGVVAHGSDVTAQVLARREVERLLAESERARAEAEAANAQLADQTLQLELSNQQLQDQAAELEMQAEELQATAEELADRTRDAERARARGVPRRGVAAAGRVARPGGHLPAARRSRGAGAGRLVRRRRCGRGDRRDRAAGGGARRPGARGVGAAAAPRLPAVA